VIDLMLLPVITKELRFDPLKDLAPVIGLVEGRLFLTTAPRQPWKTFGEMIASAKANPGKMNYGSSSPSTRIAMEALLQDIGVTVVHIPYPSGGPFIQGIVAGDVQLGLLGAATAASLGEKVRLLAVTGDKRQSAAGDVPTFAELGHPQIKGLWFSLNVTSGTPKAAIDKLYSAASRALAHPETRALLTKSQLEIAEITPEAAARRLNDEGRYFGDIARKAGIQPQ
jgi:tripartite-type tricarboxylate transporter receptor subunit TctC